MERGIIGEPSPAPSASLVTRCYDLGTVRVRIRISSLSLLPVVVTQISARQRTSIRSSAAVSAHGRIRRERAGLARKSPGCARTSSYEHFPYGTPAFPCPRQQPMMTCSQTCSPHMRPNRVSVSGPVLCEHETDFKILDHDILKDLLQNPRYFCFYLPRPKGSWYVRWKAACTSIHPHRSTRTCSLPFPLSPPSTRGTVSD